MTNENGLENDWSKHDDPANYPHPTDTKKHPLESVAEALRDLLSVTVPTYTDASFSVPPDIAVYNGQRALITLREYIANDERVEGLAEALEIATAHQYPMDGIELKHIPAEPILKAARIQLKRQGG